MTAREPLTPAEVTMLGYALDLAQEQIWSGGGFTDEDQAALDSLRRLTAASSNPADLGEWIRCGHPHCPNGERDGVARQRGWVAWPHGAWSCPQHAVIPTSQES